MNVTRKLQTYILVSLVTVLIWLYAEGQDVQRYITELPVRLVVPATSGLIVVESPTDRARVEFRGASAQIRRLREIIERQGGLDVRLDTLVIGKQTLLFGSDPLLR